MIGPREKTLITFSTNQDRRPQLQVLSPLQYQIFKFPYINIGKTGHAPWQPYFLTNQNN